MGDDICHDRRRCFPAAALADPGEEGLAKELCFDDTSTNFTFGINTILTIINILSSTSLLIIK